MKVTEREILVLKALAEGKRFSVIGEMLFLSPTAVMDIAWKMRLRAECETNIQLVVKAVKTGII